MPATQIKLYPLEVVIFYADGEAETRPCQTEGQAEVWAQLKIAQHGLAIVGWDVYPAMTTQVMEIRA